MSNPLLIWGAGGHGKVVLDVARSTGRFGAILFLDDDGSRSGLCFCGCPLIGGPDQLHRFPGSAFVIAIGDNRTRGELFHFVSANGLEPATLVHRMAVISPSASIGAGTVVMPGAIVNAGAAIGRNCIVNSGAIVEHDCRISDHVHISPRVALGGAVTIDPYAHIGIGAVVLPGAAVGEGTVVGAGAVVLKEAPAHSTVVGVPAKVLTYA